LHPWPGPPLNVILRSGETVTYKFNRAQSIPEAVTCNIRPWMKGFILPRDNPYAAVSAEDGTLRLKNLPSGDLEFQAWHEKIGYLATTAWPMGRFRHTVKQGMNDLGTVKLDAAAFNR
jgi:hypothetical protein